MYFSSTYHTYSSPEKNDVKFSELLAQDEIEALHFKYDYTTLAVYGPLKAYLEQTSHWIYDGNGRWSTSDMMVRLRSDGEKFGLEVWVISGDVKRIHQLDLDDAEAMVSKLRRIGI